MHTGFKYGTDVGGIMFIVLYTPVQISSLKHNGNSVDHLL
jgi:hypothetical protein